MTPGTLVDLGATALSVSNHGGNNLDGTPAPIRSLPAVVDAVGDQIEVLLDGGVRRGSDVCQGPRPGCAGGHDRPRVSCGVSPRMDRPGSKTCLTFCEGALIPRCSA